MLEAIPAPPHVAAYRFSGTLTGEDYDRCIDDLEAHLVEYRRIAVVADLTAMTGMTPEAVAKDFRYALSKFGEYSRFARGAVITDHDWLGKVSEMVGHLLPNTELRAFTSAQGDQAMAWAAELPAENVAGG